MNLESVLKFQHLQAGLIVAVQRGLEHPLRVLVVFPEAELCLSIGCSVCLRPRWPISQLRLPAPGSRDCSNSSLSSAYAAKPVGLGPRVFRFCPLGEIFFLSASSQMGFPHLVRRGSNKTARLIWARHTNVARPIKAPTLDLTGRSCL